MRKIFTAISFFATILSQPALSQTLFFEDFESTTNGQLPTGWTGTTVTAGTWKTGINGVFYTPNNFGGFMPAQHTRFLGLALDTMWQQNARTDILTMPSIPVQSTITYLDLTLLMDLNYIGAVGGNAKLEMSINNGASWTFVQNLQVMQWGPAAVSLPPVYNTSSIKLRIVHTSPAGELFAGLCLDNVEVFRPFPFDAQLYSLSPVDDTLHNFATPTQGVDIKAVVFNKGTSTITDLVLKYKLGNGPVQTHTESSLNITWGTSWTISHSIPCIAPTVGQHQLTAWVEVLNDAQHNNDTNHAKIFGASFMPAKRPVIEKRTGQWCGWCPRGIVYADSLESVHGDSVSIIAVHNNDGLTIPAYDSYMGALTVLGLPVSIFGFPTMVADRRMPVVVTDAFPHYYAHRKHFGYGDIYIGDATLTGNNLSLNVNFKPAIDLAGDYRLSLVIVEDSVKGYWQGNAFSYQTTTTQSFFGYENLPDPIPTSQMAHMHVARLIDAPTGIAGSLPAQMTHNNVYSYTFNATLNSGWDIDKLKAIVILTEASKPFTLNSNHRKLQSALGITTATHREDKLDIYPNPASDVVYVSLLTGKAGSIRVRLSDIYGRNVYSKNYGILPADKQSFTVPVKGLTPGIYNLQVETVNGTISKMVNIID